MSRRLVALTVAGSLALGLAGCDNGSSIDPEADADLVDDVILTADDLPAGFEEVEPDDDDTLGDDCNDELLDISRNALDGSKTAESDRVQFENAAASVRAAVTAFESDDDIVRIVEALEDDDYVDCLADELENAAEPSITVVDVESIDSPFEDDDAVVGAVSALFEINSEATGGVVVEAETQSHAVVIDRFGISLQVTAEAGEIDDELVEDLLDAMVDRLQEGLDDS